MGMNKSKQSSSQSSFGNSFVWDQQTPYLQNLFGQAQGAASGIGNPFQAGMDTISPWMQSAGSTLQGLADPTQQIATQTAALESGLGSLFQNQINPAITSNSISAGQMGGGRAGVAQGVAAGEMANAFQQGHAAITGQANQQAGNAAQALNNLGQSFFGMSGQAGMGQMAPLQMLAQILGSPTILSQQQSTGTSKGKSSSFSFPGFGS